MLVLSLIVLSLGCVKLFYFVHGFREFCECFVVFFDKHIFFFMGQLSVFATAQLDCTGKLLKLTSKFTLKCSYMFRLQQTVIKELNVVLR